MQVIADGRNSNTAGTARGYVNAAVATFNANWRAGPRPVRAAGRRSRPRLVQPESRNALEHDPRADRHAHDAADADADGDVGRARARAGHLRPAARHAVSPRRDHGRQGDAVDAHRANAGHDHSARRAALVPHSVRRIVPHALRGLGLFLLAAVGIGLLVSSVVGTMQQAMLFSFVLMMPFTLLSGLTTPISNMPEALQYFTLINPLRYAIDIAQRVYLEAATLDRLTGDLWPLVAIAVVTLSAATYMFRHRLA